MPPCRSADTSAAGSALFLLHRNVPLAGMKPASVWSCRRRGGSSWCGRAPHQSDLAGPMHSRLRQGRRGPGARSLDVAFRACCACIPVEFSLSVVRPMQRARRAGRGCRAPRGFAPSARSATVPPRGGRRTDPAHPRQQGAEHVNRRGTDGDEGRAPAADTEARHGLRHERPARTRAGRRQRGAKARSGETGTAPAPRQLIPEAAAPVSPSRPSPAAASSSRAPPPRPPP